MLRRWLGAPRVGILAAVLAAALTIPSLGNGLGIDDHLYRARVLEGWSAAHSAADLFSFADPDRPATVIDAMSSGELSWWAAPGLRWRFLRPLPQLLHHLELRVLGRGGAIAMHAHSVLWMVALALAAAALFRRLRASPGRLTPPWVAGLAAVIYAVDDGHGFTVGWLANRCMLMAACFAIAALIAHDRWRRESRPLAAVGAAGCLALALLCAEEAVGVVGYFVAYAVVLDAGSLRRRLGTLAPAAAVVVAWQSVRHALGYGLWGTGSYVDPVSEPAAFVALSAERLPILAHSALGLLPADLWEVYFVRRGLTAVMVAAGVVVTGLIVAGWLRLLRGDRLARFWALGAALALVPACGAHPTDRHLFLVGLGVSALVARTLGAWSERRSSGSEAALLPRHGAALLVGFLVLAHLVVAPIALVIRTRIPGAVSRGVERIEALVPNDPALANEELVLVNAPFKYLCNFASVVRRSNGGVSPRHWHCLGVSPDAVVVSRQDQRTLTLVPEHGYLRFFEDTNVRSRRVPFTPGDRVTLSDLAITVRRTTPDARPAEVAFTFAGPLDDHQRRWLVWRDGGYRPFVPPPVGSALTLPAERFAWSDLLGKAGRTP